MACVQYETEQESDEDCEVYFLKPVNEYNITDKIKEANKQLFSDEIVMDNELVAETQQSRKVSFAANLEEYEPQSGINLQDLENKLGKECTDNDDRKTLQKIEKEEKLEIITEEESASETEISETCETNFQEKKKEEEKQTSAAIKDKEVGKNINETEEIQVKSSLTNFANTDENAIVEEICEEIHVMDMENEGFKETINMSKSDGPAVMQRKFLKQITFDYTDDDVEEDNESLTNLLISDNETDTNEDEIGYQEYNYNESIYEDTDIEDKIPMSNTEYYEEDEEEDKLSIIVASYLQDDNDKTSLTSSSAKISPRSSKHHKLPFSKRFSFRRKTKTSNVTGSCSNRHSLNNHRFMPPPEVTDLKLHYKTCCEFKNAQQNLPKYSGYVSEYGLSREQLLQRERKLQQKQQGKVVEIFKTSEAEMRKMHDNERAFTNWLKNKMRFPINKTRNMFDVKRPFGLRKCTSVGGNISNDDTKQILNTTKYRSISAKLKKT